MRAAIMRGCRLPTLLTIGGLLLACEVDPEDPLFLYGNVQRADGSPALGTRISVSRSTVRAPPHLPDPDRPLDWELLPAEPLPLQPVVRVDGSFVAEVLRFDTLLVEDGAVWPRVLQVSAQPEEDLPPVRASVVMTDDDAQLPPLRPWRGRVVLTEERTTIFELYRVSLEGDVPPLSEDAIDVTEETTIELVDAHGEVAWRQEHKPEFGLDWVVSGMFEEGVVGARAVRRVRGKWPFRSLIKGPLSSPVEFILAQATPTAPFPKEGKRPLSRGALCPEIAPNDPCPLTDGRFTPIEIPPGLQQGFTLIFPEPQPMETSWEFTFRGMRLRDATHIEVDWQRADTGEWMSGTFAGVGAGENELFAGGIGLGVDTGLIRALRFRPMYKEGDGLPEQRPSSAILYVRELSIFPL